MMGDDGNSLRVSAYTCNYGIWNLLSQDVPAPNLRDEGTPRHATSGARIEFIWLHQNMGAKRPSFFYIRTITLGAKRRDTQIRNRTLTGAVGGDKEEEKTAKAAAPIRKEEVGKDSSD